MKRPFLIWILVTGLGATLALKAAGQTFTTLFDFSVYSDGMQPGALILSSNTLYGVAGHGGTSEGVTFGGEGTLFKLNSDGTGFTVLHTFPPSPGYSTNSDGGQPIGALILCSNTLYGTASDRGTEASGTVFAVDTSGSNFNVLHSFTAISGWPSPPINSEGAFPVAGLTLSGTTLFGTTMVGGSSGNGVVFAVNTDGSGFTNLHSFTGGSEGSEAVGGLPLLNGFLYGTTQAGGTWNKGTVFGISTNGTGFTNLYSFTGGDDGSEPGGTLVWSGNTLYGTTGGGGTSQRGVVFAINTDGSSFTNLHSFSMESSNSSFGFPINYDGVSPTDLALSANTLYGTAAQGGAWGNGTVFAINKDGTGFTTLYNFTAGTGSFVRITNSDGALPEAGLVISGNTLYGTATKGGSSGNGTVFSLSLAPQLSIMSSGLNVILTWPTNYAGFDYSGFVLQSTTNLVSPVAWTTNSASPVVVNGQNTVTNPITGTEQYYRLSR